jgi:DNA-binding transcriptional LysR family regulator
MSGVEAGLGVALLTSRPAHRVPKRVRLKKLLTPPEPVLIAVGHRENRADDKALAVFVEELRKAALALA